MRSSLGAFVVFCGISSVAGCGDAKKAEPSLAQQVDAAQMESNPEIRARKLIDISARQQQLKDAPGATATSSLALKAADEIKDPAARAEVLLVVAKQLADGGSKIQASAAIDSARVAVSTIDDRAMKVEAMVSLAEAALKMGETQTAGELVVAGTSLVEGVPNAEVRVPLLASLATVRAKVSGRPSAEPLLKSAADQAIAITDVRSRVRAQAGAAAELYDGGYATEGKAMYDAAVASATSFSDPKARGYALLDIVEALAPYRSQLPLGELTVAAQTAANAMSDLEQRNILLQQIQSILSTPR